MDIKVPPAGESVTEAIIAEWAKKDGDFVNRDEVVVVLETDKASMEVVAESAGKLQIKVAAGETVKVGQVIATLDTAAKGAEKPAEKKAEASEGKEGQESAPAARAEAPAPQQKSLNADLASHPAPSVRRIAGENGMDVQNIEGTGRGGRATKEDALQALNQKPASNTQETKSTPAAPAKAPVAQGQVERVPMTTIRKRIAERLVQAQHTAAILTTFNEIDMSSAMNLRNQYKEAFEKRHGVKLGFMGLFVKATIEALKEFPAVNAAIDGSDILYNHFYNIGMAVSTPKGLMVPVIRNADQLSIAGIEKQIGEFAVKARDGKISPDDLSGGTFTITNGGVFGSMMSTPILNPPQSGILGLHKIEDRPVVINKEIVIRPMMYVALSYDHRMIDGKESVSFLVRVKQNMEDPQRLLLEV